MLGDIKSIISPKSNQPRGNFDPKMRAHIDPLTNEIRQPSPHLTGKTIMPDKPIITFSILDYLSHVTHDEVVKVQNLIKTLQIRQSLLSETTLSSEDALCPICYAKPNSAVFKPCGHQSCQ